jgi:hypothetical protein
MGSAHSGATFVVHVGGSGTPLHVVGVGDVGAGVGTSDTGTTSKVVGCDVGFSVI